LIIEKLNLLPGKFFGFVAEFAQTQVQFWNQYNMDWNKKNSLEMFLLRLFLIKLELKISKRKTRDL